MRVLVRDLTPGQKYVIQFRARTATDVSAWSPKMDLLTSTDVLAPAAVTGLTAQAVGTAFKVRWDRVTKNTNGSNLLDFKDYEVEVVNNNAVNDSETFFVTGEVFNFTFEANKNAFGNASPRLTFKVRARDKNYNTVAVAAQASATNPAPAPPTNFTAQAVVNAINFEWDGAADEDIKFYRIYTGSSASATNMQIYEGLSENFTFSSTNKTAQWFRVASVDVFGQETLINTAISAAPLTQGDTTPPADPVWSEDWFSAETDRSNTRAIRSDVTLNWEPNQDSDLASYLVQFKKASDLVWSEVTVSGSSSMAPPTSLKINGLVKNEIYNFRLAARDKSGNTSSFVPAPGGGTTVGDTVAPGIPSDPMVSNYLGILNVAWSGLDNTGAVMAEDTEFVEIHVSTTSGFTPDETTMVAVFPHAYTGRPQEAILADLPYGVTHYVKLIAQDYTGNRSEPSGEASGAAERISGLDIEDGALSTDQINFNARDIGASVAYYQATQPTSGMLENDVWYDTDDNYKMYLYNGGTWKAAYDPRVDSYDSRITNAENAATSAQTAANGKNKITYSTSTPGATENTMGDVWFQRNASGYIIAQWEGLGGTSWASRQLDNAVIANLDAGKITAGTINADRIGANSITSDKIAAGQIVTNHMAANSINGDRISAGTLNASKITAGTITSNQIGTNLIITAAANIGNAVIDSAKIATVSAASIRTGSLAAGVSIIAGNANGTHARMSTEGFFVSGKDASGAARDYVRMGTSSEDYFAIPDPDSDEGTIAAISADGRAGFTAVDSAQDLTVLGRPLVGWMEDYPEPEGSGQYLPGWLDRFPRGIQGMTRQVSDLGNVGTSEVGLLDAGAILTPYRQYRIVAQGYINAPTTAYIQMLLRWADGTVPRITSTLLNSYILRNVQAGINSVYFETFFATGGAVTDARFLVSMMFASGTGFLYGRSTAPFHLYVEDIGPRIDSTGGPNTGGGTTSTKTTYTTTWVADSTGTYRSDGSRRTDTTDAVQGYTSYNGDQHAIILFTAGATKGQTGVTVATAMSGATLIKAEVYLYANHWYYNSGGTALISTHGYTSLTNAVPNTTKVSSANWPKPGGRWVDITSIWTTAKRGIWVGKAGGSNLTYYGRFNGAGASSNKPQLRLTYKK